jgi:hypothetical protein
MPIPEVARRKLAKLALAILTTLCLLTGASAQSTDPNHPAPWRRALAPHVAWVKIPHFQGEAPTAVIWEDPGL